MPESPKPASTRRAFFYNVRNERGESYMLYTLSGASPEALSKLPMPRKYRFVRANL